MFCGVRAVWFFVQVPDAVPHASLVSVTGPELFDNSPLSETALVVLALRFKGEPSPWQPCYRGDAVFAGVLRGAAVAVRARRDAQDDSAGAAVGGARHLHPGVRAQGRRPLQMQVNTHAHTHARIQTHTHICAQGR